MVLPSLLCLAAAVSAMPLNTYNQATHYPVKRQFTFTPLPVNDPTSTASPAVQNDFVSDSPNLPQVDPIVLPISDNVDVQSTSVPEEQQNDSVYNPSDNSKTIENVPAFLQNDSNQNEMGQIAPVNTVDVQKDSVAVTSDVVNDAEGSGEPVQNNAAIANTVSPDSTVDDSTLTLTVNGGSTEAVVETTTTQVQNSTDPVLRDEPVLVQVQQQANEAPNTQSTSVAPEVAPETTASNVVTTSTIIEVTPLTTSSGIPLLNNDEVINVVSTESTVESSSAEGSGVEIVETPAVVVNEAPVETVVSEQNGSETPLAPEDQPQLDFVDANSYGNSDADASENPSRTAYQCLNMTDSSAQNLVVNISMPSMTTSDLLSKLQSRTSRLNYTSKLDVALQLTALAHNLMTSVDDQLGSMNL